MNTFIFLFKSGANPYITKTNKKAFEMLKAFDYEQISENTFVVDDINGLKDGILSIRPDKISTYQKNKIHLEEIAKQWQFDFYKFNYSYYELNKWQSFFEECGKKYGLLTEFKENAII